MKYSIVSLSIASLAAALLAGCGKENSTPPKTEVRSLAVRVQPAQTRIFERRLAVQGSLEAKVFADVASRSDGNLDAIWVDEGDSVVAGQTALFLVDPVGRENSLAIARQNLAVAKASLDVARASARRIKAEARKAEIDFKRFERLRNEDKVSPSEFEAAEVAQAQAVAGIAVADAQIDLAQSQVRQAEAHLAIAQKNLDDAKIVAPISGVVSSRSAEPGEHMSVGKPVLRIVDLSWIEAAAFIPAQYYPEIESGKTSFRLQIGGLDAGSHAITYRSPTIDPALRTFEIKGRIDAADHLFAPGQMANLAIVFESREAVGIPSASILARNGKSVVFVVQDGKAVAREIQPGIQNDGWTEIRSGLAAGEPVVAEGQTQLRDGMPVAVL